MGITGQTISDFGGALKRGYDGPIIDQLNNLSVLFSWLDKNTEDVEASGEDFYTRFPMKIRRNQGAGARAEGAVLPIAQFNKIIQEFVPMRYNYGAIEFTGQSIKASEKNETAFAKVVETEISGLIETLELETNRQMMGDGTGHLARVNGTYDGNADATMNVDEPGTMWLEEGMPIQTTDQTLPATLVTGDLSYGLGSAGAHVVGTINDDTSFEGFKSDHTTLEGQGATEDEAVTNDYVTRFSGGLPTQGFMGIFDNYALRGTSSWFATGSAITTPQGLSRSTYPILDATISHGSNSNRALTEDLIQAALDSIEKASGKKNQEETQLLLTTYAIRRKFILELQSDRRYSPNYLDLTGGWKALAYQAGNRQLPMVVDRMCIPNTLFIPNKRHLKIYRAGDWEWMELDGNMFQRKIDSNGTYDAYEARKFCYMNLGCDNFKAQGAMRDILEI